MRSQRRNERKIARTRIKLLFRKALSLQPIDEELAQRYASLALKIGRRYNIRLPRERRMLICRHCKRLILPGSTSRIRIQPRREPHVVLTCLLCRGVSRIPLKPRR